MAVLDTRMGNEAQNGNTLRVNWLSHGTLLDFDSVEIINATDKDVERFVIQLGNIFPAHTPSFEQMTCIISSNCHLSENTLRILNKTFGHIAVDKTYV